MSSREPQPCDIPNGEHTGRLRFYANGWKCDAHSPWAAAGLDEPKPGPGMPAGAWTTPSPISDSRVHDARAVASGKRRSSPQAYRAAQAAVAKAPESDLRVDLGQWDAKTRRWIHFPTADYRCPACHETESASGDAVAHFAKHIETGHAARCSANPQGAQTA